MNFEAQVGKAARQNMDATFNTVMAAQERAAGITFPEDLKQTIHALIQTDTEKLIAEMKPTVLEDTAHVYAKYYTADEIRELQRLQSNPVLAKAQAIAPQFAAELMQIGVRRAADRMPELSRQIKAAVADWFATTELTINPRLIRLRLSGNRVVPVRVFSCRFAY
jgi:hypothetical protein